MSIVLVLLWSGLCMRARGQVGDAITDTGLFDLTKAEEVSDLQNVHASIDNNADGKLSKDELLSFWGKAVASNSEDRTEHFLKSHDHGRHGNVTLEQLLVQHATEFDADGNPAADDETVKKFEMADFDGNGQLDEQEHRAFLNPASSETMVDRIAREDMKRLDANGDGHVDLAEFAEMSPFGLEDGVATVEAKNKFSRLDTSGDGRLSLDEVKVRSRASSDKTHDMMTHMVNVADSDGDGTIDANEFVASIKEFREQDPEAAQILSALMQKHKVAAPPSSLLDMSSLVPLGAAVALVGIYLLARRKRLM